MGRISRSIELAKASWQVLRADKELLALPIISALASVVVAATFIIPLFTTGAFDEESISAGGAIGLLVMYVALAYVTIFFNAALVSAANERLTGGDPTLSSAIAGARKRAGKILPWAIVSATVSLILRSLEERAGFIGQLVLSLAGMAWAVVTFLVLPIIVIEGAGVRDAISKSGSMFKRTWGENLAAQVGFGLIGFLAVLPGSAIIVFGVSAGSGIAVLSIVLGVVWLIGVAVVMSALSVVFQTALYHYAVDGAVPSGYFDTSLMNDAFGPKSSGGPSLFR